MAPGVRFCRKQSGAGRKVSWPAMGADYDWAPGGGEASRVPRRLLIEVGGWTEESELEPPLRSEKPHGARPQPHHPSQLSLRHQPGGQGSRR